MVTVTESHRILTKKVNGDIVEKQARNLSEEDTVVTQGGTGEALVIQRLEKVEDVYEILFRPDVPIIAIDPEAPPLMAALSERFHHVDEEFFELVSSRESPEATARIAVECLWPFPVC